MADTTNAPTAPPSTTASASGLRPSLLSAKADAMWSASKQQFASSGKAISMGAIKLKTKTFSEVSAAASKKEEETTAEKPKFIFGQNVQSRLIHSGLTFKPENGSSGETKKTEDIFKQTAEKTGENVIVPKSFEAFKKEAEELAAKEKDEHEKNLPTTSVIEVKTGEEDDQVLFQSGCKIHVFDKQQKRYVEKGMAMLKISKRYDEEGEHSRIVARTTGIHKLVINSPIFADMMLERVDQKRIKISAMGVDEPPTIQIFLVAFSFTNSELSIDGALNTLQSLIHKAKVDGKTRKRKMSEEQVTEVETKMEKTELKGTPCKFETGGFDDGDHSSSSLSSNEPSDAHDPALEAENEQQTTSDPGTDSN